MYIAYNCRMQCHAHCTLYTLYNAITCTLHIAHCTQPQCTDCMVLNCTQTQPDAMGILHWTVALCIFALCTMHFCNGHIVLDSCTMHICIFALCTMHFCNGHIALDRCAMHICTVLHCMTVPCISLRGSYSSEQALYMNSYL